MKNEESTNAELAEYANNRAIEEPAQAPTPVPDKPDETPTEVTPSPAEAPEEVADRVGSRIGGTFLVIAFAISLLTGCITTGCTTVQTANGPVRVVDSNKVDSVAIMIRAVTSDGALLAMKYDRNAEAYLRLAATTLDAALLSKDVSATSIRKSLTAIPVKELHGELAAVGIQTALTAYEVFASNHLKGLVGENYFAATLIAAIRDGITGVLGPPVAKIGWPVFAWEYMPTL